MMVLSVRVAPVAEVHPLQLRNDPLIANEWKKHFGAEVPGLKIRGVWPWDEP